MHEQDTFASRLERLLNEQEPSREPPRGYEVINCGVPGYGTRQEHLFYRLIGSKYQPHIVLLMMVWNDDLSYLEELERGYDHEGSGAGGRLFLAWGKVQQYRQQQKRFDYSRSVVEVHELAAYIRENGGRLFVGIFRTDTGDSWNRLRTTMERGLEGTAIPVLDLGTVLLTHRYEDIIVHEIDEHPNEIAHGRAAEEIARFMREEGLLHWPQSVDRN